MIIQNWNTGRQWDWTNHVCRWRTSLPILLLQLKSHSGWCSASQWLIVSSGQPLKWRKCQLRPIVKDILSIFIQMTSTVTGAVWAVIHMPEKGENVTMKKCSFFMYSKWATRRKTSINDLLPRYQKRHNLSWMPYCILHITNVFTL